MLGVLALAVGAYVALTDWRTLALGLALRLPFALQFVERSVQVRRLAVQPVAAGGIGPGLQTEPYVAYEAAPPRASEVRVVSRRAPCPLRLALRRPHSQVTSAYERLETATAAAAGARAAECLGAVRALQANTAEAAEVAGYAALLGAHVRVRRASAIAVSLLRHTEKIVVAASDVIILAVRAGVGCRRAGGCGCRRGTVLSIVRSEPAMRV